MKTPEQIRDMEFQKSPMGGYKQSDVELFLEEVASQIEILMKQKADSDRKLQEFSRKAPEAALSTAGIQNVLISAQRVADQITEEAKEIAEKTVAESNLKLTEAEIKAREIIADAEKKAVLLGETAQQEAEKIIADATEKSQKTLAEAKEAVELEQRLYDRLLIEVSDFRKKAAAQCGALMELINQLPAEIPFNMERSKTVLSMDFSEPAELLAAAVNERLAKENAAIEEAGKAEPEQPAAAEEPAAEEPTPEIDLKSNAEPAFGGAIPVQAAPVEEQPEPKTEEPAPAFEPEEKAEPTPDFGDMQLMFGIQNDDEIAEPEAPAVKAPVFREQETVERPAPKGHISFGEDDDFDDEDDDDEPRIFFRKKKK